MTGVAATRSGAITGIVLCGGHSRRMGRPKAWLPFGEEFLLQRVVRIVGEAVGTVIVVAAKGQSLPPLPDGVPRVDDQVEDRGPLGGLAAGLATATTDLVFLTACDAPFLNTDFIASLVAAMEHSPSDTIVPFTSDFHPLTGIYRTSIRAVVEHRLAAGQLRMKDLIREVNHQKWFPAESLRAALRNINTPDDYATALEEYNRRYGNERLSG
jgi:molybdopterin-guanine dinucleotide biosynthesis protein A